jgi:hypothetical protein
MKTRLLLIGLTVSLLMIAAQKKPKTKSGPRWKEFTSKEGGFSVLLPGIPMQDKKALQIGSRRAELNSFVVEQKREETAYIVVYCDFPGATWKGDSPEERLECARARAIASSKGKPVSEKKIKLGTFSGRELRFDVKDKGQVRQQLFAVKERLFQLMIAGPKDMTNSQDAGKFFKSFKLSVAAQ